MSVAGARDLLTHLPRWNRRLWPDVGLVLLALVVDLALWGGDGTLRGGGSVPPALVVVLAVPVFASLTLRRRWPRSVYVVAWVYTVAVAFAIPFYEPFTALLVALRHISRHLPLRQGLPFLVATAVPWALNTRNAVVLVEASAAETAGIVAGWFALTAVVWVAGRFWYRAEETAGLREQHREAQAALVIQDERLRLARELHDSVANSVTAVLMQAAGARHAAARADPELDKVLGAIERSATHSMHELRRLLGLLRADAEEEATASAASLDDLDPLLDSIRACSVDVQLWEEGSRIPLDPSIDHAAYRVLQESLANAVKHAGPESEATVNLDWRKDSLIITVRSAAGEKRPHSSAPVHAGLGTGGLGLPGLKERVAALGGRVDAGFVEDSDFRVTARLPTQRQPSTPRARRPPAHPETDDARS